MTDKQIIIDDVDVSGCLFYQTNFQEDYDVEIKHYCSNWHNSCESNNNSNCYYKQLAREKQECQQTMDNYVQLDLQRVKEYNELVDLYKAKEQECEELKKIINEAKNSNLDLKSFLVGEAVQNEYEQQLHKLKVENNKLKEELEAVYDNCKGCPTCNETLYNANLYAKEYRKLKQTLTKIKEIAETENNDIKVLYNRRTHQRIKQILQKISEVE